MYAFRLLMIVIFVVISGYTAVVAAEHGLGLIPIFLRDIAALGWPGQFNVDFACFLVLSATWLAWRHQFSPAGLVLAVFGFFGGALFLSAYLLYMSLREKGDITAVLLGNRRTA
ncbi:MAG: hypothetical protein HC809_00445 [Gammaproteobacteria bacterium]|nr:hypothetical protein [Gammaproteobacteria bacterium]